MKLLFVLFIFLCLNAEEALQTRTKVLMSTFATISLNESNKGFFKGAFTILSTVDTSLSSYNQNSPIYKLNKNKKADINLYAYEALLLSQKYYIKSAGYFNIAIGSVTKDLYRFGEDERVPRDWELNASDTSFDTLTFDKHSAKLGQGVKIDLGGFGKGYGVDRVVEYLKINNVKKARVALSGDIRCLGICEISINNPYSDIALLRFITRKEEMATSTSGNYNHFVGTENNNHLINPKTKQSQKTFISITLISTLPNSDVDAYATAASVMPKELAYKFLDSLDLAYVILESDRKLVISENISLYVNVQK